MFRRLLLVLVSVLPVSTYAAEVSLNLVRLNTYMKTTDTG